MTNANAYDERTIETNFTAKPLQTLLLTYHNHLITINLTIESVLSICEDRNTATSCINCCPLASEPITRPTTQNSPCSCLAV